MVAPHGSPIQPSLYAVIKFCTASQLAPPLTNSDLSNIEIWSVQDIGKNGSNLNKGDSGDFCDLFTTHAYEYSEIGCGQLQTSGGWKHWSSSGNSEKIGQRMHDYGPRPDPGELSKWCYESLFSLLAIFPFTKRSHFSLIAMRSRKSLKKWPQAKRHKLSLLLLLWLSSLDNFHH